MVELVIRVPIPEGFEEFFATRDMMVTPVSDEELRHFATALHLAADTVGTATAAVATFDKLTAALAEVMKVSEIVDPPALAATLDSLREALLAAAGHLDFVRTTFGRSARVGRLPDREGPVQ